MKIHLNGEFGYELIYGLPLINHLKEQGEGVELFVPKGSKWLYPNMNVNEVFNQRIPFMQLEIDGEIYYRQHHHIGDLWDTSFYETNWSPPDLKSHYKEQYKIRMENPLLIVSNKYQIEWGEAPVNYISEECLREIFELTRDKFTVVYNRPGNSDITLDNSPQMTSNDYSLCRELGIYTIQDFMNDWGMEYNETQIALYANCDHFVSTQGGNSAYAAYFGGVNTIFGIRGSEITSNAYSTFFPKLSNQTIYHETTYDGVIKRVKSYVK